MRYLDIHGRTLPSSRDPHNVYTWCCLGAHRIAAGRIYNGGC